MVIVACSLDQADRVRSKQYASHLARKSAPDDNGFLSALLPADFALLHAHLQATQLPQDSVIVRPSEPVDFVYFLTNGIATLTARCRSGLQAGMGLVGRESFLHPAAILGSVAMPIEARAQTGCHAYRLPLAQFRAALGSSATLHRQAMDHVEAQFSQVASTCLSAAVCGTVVRLARWLLMFHDRCEGDSIVITHNALAGMLAVRRPTVTQGLHILEGERLIRSERNIIWMRDRPALESFAADAYGAAEMAHHPPIVG